MKATSTLTPRNSEFVDRLNIMSGSVCGTVYEKTRLYVKEWMVLQRAGSKISSHAGSTTPKAKNTEQVQNAKQKFPADEGNGTKEPYSLLRSQGWRASSYSGGSTTSFGGGELLASGPASDSYRTVENVEAVSLSNRDIGAGSGLDCRL